VADDLSLYSGFYTHTNPMSATPAPTAVRLVGELAKEQEHHPDIFLAWGKVEIRIWTHNIHGLTESDFILAAKINQTCMRN